MPHPWGHRYPNAYSPFYHSHFHRHYHRGRGFGRLIFWGLIGGGIWAWYHHRQERRQEWERFLASGGLNGTANTNTTIPSEIESANVRVSGEIKPWGETPRQWHGGWQWGCHAKNRWETTGNANATTPAQQPSTTTQHTQRQDMPNSIVQQVSAQRQDAFSAQSQDPRQTNGERRVSQQSSLNATDANLNAAVSPAQSQRQVQRQNEEELFLPSYAQFINARQAEQQAEEALLQAQQARQFAEDAYIQALPYVQAKEQGRGQQGNGDRRQSRSGWWWSGNDERNPKNLLNE